MKNFIGCMLLISLLCLTGCSLPSFTSSGADTGKSGEETGVKTAIPEGQGNDNLLDRTDPGVNAAAEKEKSPEPSPNHTKTPDPKAPVVKASVEKNRNDGDGILVTLYYQDSEGFLIPVTRKLARQESIARAAVDGLVDNAINREEIEYYGLYPVLPMGSKILGINIKDGTATIDFNSTILGCRDGAAERNMIAAVVYTLTGFTSVDNVRIQVNGYPQKTLKFGSDISGTLNRANVLLNAEKTNLGPGRKKVDIFLFKRVSDSRYYILPMSVEQDSLKDEEMPVKIVELLEKDYSATKLFSQMPSKVRLLQSSLKGNILTLDFSPELKSYGGGTTREEGLLKQILYSMRQVKGTEKVKILIGGKTGTLPEGTDLSRELELPRDINNIIQN